jgi:protein O-mannosyl-transferase
VADPGCENGVRWWQTAFLVLLAALPWVAVPWGSFQFDDFGNLVRDPATADIAVFAEHFFDRLRPLTRLSYILDAHLFGVEPAGFLTINLLLHLVTTALVFALARRRAGLAAACVAALVFSLQPANAEVVAYVSGRSTGLMTPLLLGALLFYDRSALVGAAALFLLACLAKEVALVFPVLIAVWEAGRATPQAVNMRRLTGFAAIAIAAALALLASSRYRSLLGYSLNLRPLLDNLLVNGRAVPEMLSLWFRPWALSVDHGFDTTMHLAASVAGLAGLALACGGAVLLRRRVPMLMLACVWPVVALLPTNSLLPKVDLITEKPLYLAWVGPAIAIGYAATLLQARSRLHAGLAAAFGGVLLCLGATACAWRVSLWADPAALWLDATRKAPDKSRCWNNLGMAHQSAGRMVEARDAFLTALRLDPTNALAEDNFNRALVLCGRDCAPGRATR